VLLFVLVWMLGPALGAPFLNIFFTRRLAVSVGQVGLIFAGAHLVWGACVMGSGEVATRTGTRYLLTATLAVFAPAVWGLSLASSLGAAVGLFILQGAVSPITNPLIDQLLLERVPPERHGAMSGWRNVAADVSAIIGASVGGQILAASSFGSLLVWAGVVGLVGAVGLTAALRLTPIFNRVASTSSAP
jgi:predicted MFS family arabinose efflux permease